MLLLPSVFVISVSAGGGPSTQRYSSFILSTSEVQRLPIIQNVHAFKAGQIWYQDMGPM